MIEMPSSTQHTELCAKIKARRKELGFTQAAMAERLGIRQPTYAAIELGVKDPKLSTLFRVAEALDTTLADLCNAREPVEQ